MVNGRGHLMVEKIAARLPAQAESELHPEERHGDAGDAEVVGDRDGSSGFAATNDRPITMDPGGGVD